GAGDLLEIAPPGARTTVYLPFTRAFVPEVDVAGGVVVIAPPDDFPAPPRPAPDEIEVDAEHGDEPGPAR
ncbi:MAG: hypothetical protein ACFE0R_01520, partial [Salinarimonas sp.]